jgi:YHS domain-containing protein
MPAGGRGQAPGTGVSIGGRAGVDGSRRDFLSEGAMRNLKLSAGALLLVLVAGALGLASPALGGSGAKPAAGSAGVAAAAQEADSALVAVDNARDPICGMAVSRVPEENTSLYKGKTIGFCCPQCRESWERLSPDEKDKKLASAATAEEEVVKPEDYRPLPKPGKQVRLDSDRYFVYGFAKPPKLGTAIMKVQVFTNDGQRDTTCIVLGDVDMPSMRGAHTTGNREFARSAVGIYLLPVSLVMPGDWEFRFTFLYKGKTALRGAYLFDL